MSNHLSVTEIAEFCTAKAVNPSFLALAARVNSHIVSCEECRETYHAFLEAGEAIDKLEVSRPLQHPRSGIELEHIKAQLRDIGLSISKFVNGWSGLNISIPTLQELECEAIDAMTNLYHPPYAAVAKSLDSKALSRKAHPPVIKSTLTDGGGSRLSVGEDGTLSLFLVPGEADVDTMVALTQEKDESTTQFQFLQPYDGETLTAKFMNIIPGNYYVSLIKVAPEGI